jgi:folate-binding protein YgfZ
VPGTALRIARRPRGFVGVRGPEAASYLQRMLSNDVEALTPGESCDALLLTPKGRVIAPLVAWRREENDFLLVTEPALAARLRDELLRGRFAAKAEIELEEHTSVLILGREAPSGGIANRDYGMPAYELVDDEPPDWTEIDDEELERLRIRARTPRFGRELDDRVLPAEAGLDERAISFTKGCFPGQEPIARLHYRGHANRSLRVLSVEGEEPPAADAELTHDGKVVGRVTSAVRDPDSGIVALGYVRVEVPAEAELSLDGRSVRQLDVDAVSPT